MILAVLAALLLAAGAAALYIAAPHQSLTVAKAGRTAVYAGMGALAGALVVLLSLMGPAAAVFTWTTGLMLLWSVPPVLIRWLRYRRESAR
jgi:hypothetical protein